MRNKQFIGKIDIWLFVIYLALMTIGLLSIYAAAFNADHPHIWDFSQNYGKQLVFIGVSLLIGFLILLIDAKVFNTFAYVIYGLSIFCLLLVLAIGSKISGSTSWIQLGPISFQPSEFAKFGTALAYRSAAVSCCPACFTGSPRSAARSFSAPCLSASS